jgi:hypothetical protein
MRVYLFALGLVVLFAVFEGFGSAFDPLDTFIAVLIIFGHWCSEVSSAGSGADMATRRGGARPRLTAHGR